MEDNTPPPGPGSVPNVPPVPPPPPLPPPPPPVIGPAAGPRQPRRGRGWMVFALILLVLLGISMLYNLGNFARMVLHGGRSYHYAASRTAGPRIDEALIEDHDSANKIAIVKVDGIITGEVIDQGGFSMVDIIKAQLKHAQEDKAVKGVILKVDSPGGEVLAADEIYRAIRDFQTNSAKPVVVSMGSLAASGGYYVSAPCRWIVANDMTITGSIGVIMSTWNYRGLMDKVGLLPQTFKSGKFKDMLSGSREPDSISPEEKKMVQDLIDETFAKFKKIVQEGREQAYSSNRDAKPKGQPLNDNWQDYADGRVLSGTEAYRLGFVDQLGTFQTAVERVKDFASIDNANLVEYQQRFDLSDLFHLFGKSESKGVKVDFGMDLPRLQAGRLYFLSPTFLH